jgi:hypothetical protein
MAVLVVVVLEGAAPARAVVLVRITVDVDRAMVREVCGVRCSQVEGQRW